MGRRKQEDSVDWDAIERAYRLGNQSNGQIAEIFKVDRAHIGRQAKKFGWVQDKRKEVQAVTESVLIQVAAAKALDADGNARANASLANPNATPTPLEIKTAGFAAAAVVIGQQNRVARLIALEERLTAELEVMTEHASVLQAYVKSIDTSGETDSGRWVTDKKAEMMQAILDAPARIDSMKKLVEIDEKLRKGEREAFGIKPEEGERPPVMVLDFGNLRSLSPAEFTQYRELTNKAREPEQEAADGRQLRH